MELRTLDRGFNSSSRRDLGSNFEDKLSSLSPSQLKEFRNLLLDSLEDRSFFELYGLDYVNPDVPRIKEIVLGLYISYLHGR